MDRTADCELLARRTVRAGLPPSQVSLQYSDCIILSAPADLPDGDYILCFAGHSTVAHRIRGLWSSFGAVVRDRSADDLEEGRPVDPGALAPPHADSRRKAASDARAEKHTKEASLDGEA